MFFWFLNTFIFCWVFGWSRLNADDCYIINTFRPIQWRDNFIQRDSVLLWKGSMLFELFFCLDSNLAKKWSTPKNNAQNLLLWNCLCSIATFVHFYLWTLFFQLAKETELGPQFIWKVRNCQTKNTFNLHSYSTEGGIFYCKTIGQANNSYGQIVFSRINRRGSLFCRFFFLLKQLFMSI